MKKLLITISLSMLAGPPSAAVAADAKPAAGMEPKAEKSAAAAKPAPVLVQAPPRMAGRAQVDARECLKLATNREIHGCAEKFR